MPRKNGKIKKTGKGKRRNNTKTRKNASRRYRGGCKDCVNSDTDMSKGLTPLYGGNPHGNIEFSSDKISQDIYNYKMDSHFQ